MSASNDNARPMPIAISSANCVAMTGMSWSWVTRFARANGVAIWRVGVRKQLIPGAALAEAMQRVAATAPELSLDDACAAYEAELIARMRKLG
jgi:hypothetical protein